MRRSRFSEAQIIGMLKEQDGLAMADVFRRYSLSPATFYKLRAKFGRLEDDKLKLKRLLAEAMPENTVQKYLFGKL
jgi:putative transposase